MCKTGREVTYCSEDRQEGTTGENKTWRQKNVSWPMYHSATVENNKQAKEN